jgi:hypothetical protein
VPAKKKSAAAEKELKATVKKLRSKLERADARTKRWKDKARTLEKSMAESEAQRKKLTKPNKRLAKDPAPEQDPSTATDAPEAAILPELEQVDSKPPESEPEPAPAGPRVRRRPASSAAARPTPDASWTVVRLRAEARSRGLSGLSNKSKADLLEALG